MNPLALARAGLRAPGAVVGGLLDRLSPGRHRRRVWVGHGKAHIEVRGVHHPGRETLGAAVEDALRRVSGVKWAQVNSVMGRVVVAFDPEEGPSVDDLLEVVEDVEEAHEVDDETFPHNRPEHPGDVEPLRRQAIAIGADVLALGGSVFGQLLRATPVPAELGTLVALAENDPRIRRFLAEHLGVALTDLGLGVTSAFVQSLSQGPLTLVTDITHRANLLGERSAARHAWERREAELCAEPVDEPLPAVGSLRPAERHAGPVERWADLSGALGVAGAVATLVATTSPWRAAGVATAAVPKAARHGREAFSARLGRELAARDVLVLDAQALRRLDRVDTVLLDAPVVLTGRLALGEVEPLGDEDPGELGRRALQAFDPSRPARTARRARWTLAPLETLEAQLEPSARARARALARRCGHPRVLALVRAGELRGLVGLEPELDPLAEPLARAVRRAGRRLVVAGRRSGVGDRLGADDVVAGGTRLLASVRALQAEGCAVLLVSGGSANAALRAADVGVGVDGHGAHPPWGADVLTRTGLADAHLLVESLPVARSVSSKSAALAAVGSATGAAASLLGPASGAARRAAVPVNVAALVAQATGTLAAASLGRRPAPSPAQEVPWHAMETPAVLRALGSSRAGLSPAEAARRAADLPAPAEPRLRLARAVAQELANPLTPVLAAGAGLAAAVGSATDAALVAAVSATNAVVGGVQRVRAEASIGRLLRAMTGRVTVRRGGRPTELEPERLVRGDIVELRAGDVVPADCRILDAEDLEVDESALTGESLPVAKAPEPVSGATLPERTSMLYEGSVVSTGSALAVVVAVRDDTEVGRTLADAPEPPPSGVEARLSELTHLTVPATLASGAAVAGMGLLRGRSPRAAVSSGVSLMVAAVPEGLPLLATVAQLSAAHRLAARGALVRNPRTIEALGRVDVLCFDKTGTLTAGRIALQLVSDGAGDTRVSPATTGGPSGDASGARDDVSATWPLPPRHRDVLAAAVRASPLAEDGDPLPHATDRAVVEGAEAAGVTASEGLGGWTLLDELAFEPSRGYHAVVGDSPSGVRVSVKGAPETVLPRCSSWRAPGAIVPLDRRTRRRLDAEVERLASEGLRVLAVAERPASSRAGLGDERVRDMELLGFLGLADGVRPSAAAAVAGLREAGVAVVMITGDHPSTAAAVAEELDLLRGARVVTGAELERLGDAELEEVLGRATVFARVTPAQKLRIVRAYQHAGRTVAMIGDGANDAPAIRLAHTGIALGGRGSPAAREAADLVVLDDRLETVIDAIVEGRAMWASVREALAILVGGNLGEVGFTLAATALSGSSPLGARQLLLVNLLTDMLPATTIAMRPPARRSPSELLHEGPDSSFGAALARQIALRAATTCAGATGAWLVARPTGSGRRASSVALAALVGTQLTQTAVVGRESPLVLASVAASAALLVAVVQTPGVSHFFGCTPMGPAGWGIALGGAATATGASLVLPRLLPRRPLRAAHPDLLPAALPSG
jgi:cation-transporting ATPase I